MATLDASVIGDIGTQPDIGSSIGQAYQLKDMMNENTLKQYKLREAKQTEQDTATSRKVLSKYDLSNSQQASKAASELQQKGLTDQAMSALKASQSYQTGEYERQIQQLTLQEQRMNFAGEQYGPIYQKATEMRQAGKTDAEISAYIDSNIPTLAKAIQESDLLDPAHKKAALQRMQANPHLTFDQLTDMVNQIGAHRSAVQQKLADLTKSADVQKTTAEAANAAAQPADRAATLSERKRHDVAMEDASKQKVDQSQLNQQQLDAEVSAIGEYRSPPPSPGNRSVQAQKLLADVQQKYPNYDYTNWQAKSKAVQAFSTGTQGNVVRSLNVGVQHLNVLDQLATSLANNDTQAVNKLSNLLSEQTGSPKVTNFNLAKQIVATEVIKGTAGSVGALADRDAVVQQIKASESPAQLAGAIKIAKRLMAGQLKGLEQQYSQATGLSNFSDRLAPETVTELEGTAAPAPAAAASSAAPPPAIQSLLDKYK